MADEVTPTSAEIDRHIAGDVDPVRDHLLARAVAAEAERDAAVAEAAALRRALAAVAPFVRRMRFYGDPAEDAIIHAALEAAKADGEGQP